MKRADASSRRHRPRRPKPIRSYAKFLAALGEGARIEQHKPSGVWVIVDTDRAVARGLVERAKTEGRIAGGDALFGGMEPQTWGAA